MEDLEFSTGHETAPTQGTALPWVKEIRYKAGKTQKNYANDATAQRSGAGFSYYDKEEKQNNPFALPATLVICEVVSGISGTIEQDGRFSNFYSNKVLDTRTQAIRVYESGRNFPVITGLYKEIKDQLPAGAKFQSWILAMHYQTKEAVLIEVSAGISIRLKKAIAERVGCKPDKVNLWGLGELTTKLWSIRMSGEYERVTKDGNPYEGKDDLFFVPKMEAGTIYLTEDASGAIKDTFAKAEQIRADFAEYLAKTQDKIWRPEPAKEQSTEQAPTNAKSVFPEQIENMDDLPF